MDNREANTRIAQFILECCLSGVTDNYSISNISDTVIVDMILELCQIYKNEQLWQEIIQVRCKYHSHFGNVGAVASADFNTINEFLNYIYIYNYNYVDISQIDNNSVEKVRQTRNRPYMINFLRTDYEKAVQLFQKYKVMGNSQDESVAVDEIVEPSEPTIKQEKSTIEIIPLFGNAFYKGKNTILYGGPKVGKSYLSIEIAKHESIKKPLFIILEDYSHKQEIRYTIALSNKAFTLISLDDFEDKYSQEVYKRVQDADQNAYWETGKDLALFGYQHFKRLCRQNYVDMGIIKHLSDKLNKITVIEHIIANALNEGVDFICIDPLFAIVEGSGNNLNRDHLKRIIKPTSSKQVTLLLLHHTNKKGEMSLTQDLSNTFDNIYRLDLISSDDMAENEDMLRLTEEQARYNKRHVLTIKRTISSNQTATHEVLETKVFNPENREAKTNMKSMIKEIIENYDGEILPYQELVDTLKERTGKENDEANIMKHLKSLKEKDNLIDMADGNTWKGGIKILSSESTAY